MSEIPQRNLILLIYITLISRKNNTSHHESYQLGDASIELSFTTLLQLSSPKDVCCTIRTSLYCCQILRNHKPLIFATVVQRVFASLVLPDAVLAYNASLVSSVTLQLAN